MKLSVCFLATSTLIMAQEPQSTPEQSLPSIHLSVCVGNTQQAPANNTTVVSPSQTIAPAAQVPLPPRLIIIKDERSTAKDLFHRALLAGLGMAVVALSKSEKVAEIASTVWSKIN